jgi:hypothetical protein
LNGGQTGFDHFIGTARPVRIWYNARLISGDGTPIRDFWIGQTSVHREIASFRISAIPHLEFTAVPDLKSVIVVVDLTLVGGLDWRQVTDYIAMIGTTQVNLNGRLAGAPTIMSLFSSSENARPQALSSWDKSFIKELYSTDPVFRHQRELIARGMFQHVASDPEEQSTEIKAQAPSP